MGKRKKRKSVKKSARSKTATKKRRATPLTRKAKKKVKKKTTVSKSRAKRKKVAPSKKKVKKKTTASKPRAKRKKVAPSKKKVKKKTTASKPRAKKKKAAPSKKKIKKKKVTPSKPKRAKESRKPTARKKPTPPKKIPFSKALKDQISTVLVTGATRCVGSFLVQHLLREGYSVIATDHKDREILAQAETARLVFKAGDLSNPTFAASCLEGVDAIFHPGTHADGKPHFGDPGPSPVDATRNLYQQARERGVKRFILITSASLYGRHHGPVSEDGTLESRDEYEQTQSELESIVLGGSLPGLPSVTVLRPAAVYGPGCMSTMASLATLPPLVTTLGPYFIPFSGGPRMNLVHGDDVARAAAFLLLHPTAYGSIFNVADNDPMPFGHFVNVAMESFGLKALGPGVAYPPSTLLQSILPYVEEDEIFSPLGNLSNILWERIVRTHRLNKNLMPRLDQGAVPLGTRDLVVDNGKLLGLGFRLKYPKFRRGWEKTLAWYQKKRWIPRPNEL
jgi:nucleoside-diphosphate-sugar epimerase